MLLEKLAQLIKSFVSSLDEPLDSNQHGALISQGKHLDHRLPPPHAFLDESAVAEQACFVDYDGCPLPSKVGLES